MKRCHDEKVIQNGLRITLEPYIGNIDDEFNTKYYERLNGSSLTLMEDVIVFCNKTVENVSSEISATEFKLNKKLQREE